MSPSLLDRAKRAIYASEAWDSARSQAKWRDECQCRFEENGVRCTVKRRLHVHHVTPLELGGDPFDLENLLTLCPKHHRQEEAILRSRAATIQLVGLSREARFRLWGKLDVHEVALSKAVVDALNEWAAA